MFSYIYDRTDKISSSMEVHSGTNFFAYMVLKEKITNYFISNNGSISSLFKICPLHNGQVISLLTQI